MEIKKEKARLGINNYTIYNSKEYRLTHLLEHGHVNRDGTRTRAFPHIGKVEQEALDLLLDEIGKRI